jgi:hypothetical protein
MTNALVETVVDMPMDFTVIATSPKDMEAGQRSLILWAARKIQMVKNELEEFRAQFKACQDHKWNASGWRSQILKAERRADFYRKIKSALEAGYYIVPPFPVDIFAIRTNKELPNRNVSRHSNNHDQLPAVLPEGEGRYVNNRPIRDKYRTNEKQGDGTTRSVTNYYASDFQDVDFPFKLARAEIRSLTDAAMKLKVFDRLGVLPRVRNPDPIVCGQILVPDKPFWRGHDDRKLVNFFVAWFFDPRVL